MLEPQRLFARLNPMTVDWQNTIAVTSDVLKAEDIAACLAGLPRGPYLLVRYLWCGDDSVAHELFSLLIIEGAAIAHQGNWSCKDDLKRIKAFIKMALYELQNANLCKRCNGTGVLIHQPCTQCNGQGKKKLSQTAYAQFCGVKRCNWQRSWAFKYQEIYLFIVQWNEMAIDHVLSRL